MKYSNPARALVLTNVCAIVDLTALLALHTKKTRIALNLYPRQHIEISISIQNMPPESSLHLALVELTRTFLMAIDLPTVCFATFNLERSMS
jgi:hypothetical protein